MSQFTPPRNGSLFQKVVSGSLWIFGLRLINQTFGFLRTIVLARLLFPEDFGLFGIAALAISTLQTFSQTGFHAALIQKKENIVPYLNTAWTISVFRGGILFAALYFSAPLIAGFFNSSQALWIIRIIAFSTLVTGLKNIGIIFFQKELAFYKHFFYEFSCTLVNFSVTVVLAFVLRNVWALVWGNIAANLFRVFMSYAIHPYRPAISLDKDRFLYLFRFGRWILGSGIVLFLINQGDDILVGKLLGAASLGFYQMAFMLSNLPATEISQLIAQVTYPAYSKLQDDPAKVRAAYLRVLQLTAFLSIPLAGGIFIFASDFTRIFLGDKWMPMVPIMKTLAVAGMIRSIGSTIGPVLNGMGKPDILTKLALIKLLVMGSLIVPMIRHFGLFGAAACVVLSSLVSNPIASYTLIKLINCRLGEFLKPILFPLGSTLAVGMIVSSIKPRFPITGIPWFIAYALSACGLFCLFTLMIEKRTGHPIKTVVTQAYHQIK